MLFDVSAEYINLVVRTLALDVFTILRENSEKKNNCSEKSIIIEKGWEKGQNGY